ncbi:hypothetical protein T261_8598 [Streptomyces lydicus]|nr:hypothetical protein T261_8598 [Streptomyces lydicus]
MPAGAWTDEMLDWMRGTGDAAGDAAISETYELGRQEEVRQALRGFGKNSEALPTGLPPRLQRYFELSSVLPEWADPELIERGRALLGRYEALVVSTLLCGSLPLCYGCGDGAEVLARSQRLTSGVYRRLMETSQFVVDVLDDGGLGPGDAGCARRRRSVCCTPLCGTTSAARATGMIPGDCRSTRRTWPGR